MVNYLDALTLIDAEDLKRRFVAKQIYTRKEIYRKIKNSYRYKDVAEVRHSHWIEQRHMTDIRSTYFMCADCNRIVEMPRGNDIKKYAPYCNCGAKMDGGKK